MNSNVEVVQKRTSRSIRKSPHETSPHLETAWLIQVANRGIGMSAGGCWGASGGAEERQLGGRVRSSLRAHSRLGCLSVESDLANAASFEAGPPVEHRKGVGHAVPTADFAPQKWPRTHAALPAEQPALQDQANAAFTAADTCDISALPANWALTAAITLDRKSTRL